ncbi:hypothetical protein A3K78_04040 [Candidatus Bathyarchaeota archaeon RBG_13_52_12]|nr:MAG: hypothetical protein A3K78_04040 [Candidatus Bathyarchaeota archaeon RBG_13_52_12]
MNISNINLLKASSLILLIGVLGDEVTTLTGISSGRFVESNPYASQLINNGSWILMDLVSIMFFVSIPFILIKGNRDQSLVYSFLPLLPGLIRLFACVSNLVLITGV